MSPSQSRSGFGPGPPKVLDFKGLLWLIEAHELTLASASPNSDTWPIQVGQPGGWEVGWPEG